MMRALEMRESLGILQQAFEQLPAGPIMNPKVKIAPSSRQRVRLMDESKDRRASWGSI
jgi:NADH:ubiquinone oxidoreductase subunit D